MSANSRPKVAVITGANAGLGFNLAQKLVQAYPDIHVCLACRNKERAMEAVNNLKSLSPEADISIVVLDTSSVSSVYIAAQEIRDRYDHIDYLYLNAGMMKVKGVDWGYFWKGIFSTRIIYMLTTGEGLLKHEDSETEDGLQRVFETNVFGHYVLIKELEDRLGSIAGNNEAKSQVIWTSSSAASKRGFSIDNFQHKNGLDPYGSSKYAMDVISVGLNEKMNKKNVYTHSVCPGLVMTNMTYGILPPLFWKLIIPLIWLFRLFVPSMTNTTANGTEALFWLSHQDPATLDPQTKYLSVVSVLGKPYVSQQKMNIEPDMSQILMKELDKLDHNLRKRNNK